MFPTQRLAVMAVHRRALQMISSTTTTAAPPVQLPKARAPLAAVEVDSPTLRPITRTNPSDPLRRMGRIPRTRTRTDRPAEGSTLRITTEVFRVVQMSEMAIPPLPR